MEDQINVYNDAYRNSYRNIINPEIKYVSNQDIQLRNTADQDPWFSSEQTGSLICNLNLIKIVLIDDDANIVEIFEHLVASRDIGLILMGPEINRKHKPHLIVLTTEDRYYAMGPDDDRGIAMLRRLLIEPSVSIWTSNGLGEADCLYHRYGIKLEHSRAKCCTGLHMHLMRVLKPFPKSEKKLAMYPIRALERSRGHKRFESYETLAWIWLDADRRDLYQDNSKMIHLGVRPLNLTAMNLIRKRCCLVIRLAKELMKYIQLELNAMNRNIMYSLSVSKTEVQLGKVREKMKDNELKQIASVQYFAHLNGIFANPLTPAPERRF